MKIKMTNVLVRQIHSDCLHNKFRWAYNKFWIIFSFNNCMLLKCDYSDELFNDLMLLYPCPADYDVLNGIITSTEDYLTGDEFTIEDKESCKDLIYFKSKSDIKYYFDPKYLNTRFKYCRFKIFEIQGHYGMIIYELDYHSDEFLPVGLLLGYKV